MAVENSDIVVIEGQLHFEEFLRFNLWYLWRRFKVFVLLIFFVAFVYPLLAVSGVLGPNAGAAEGKEWTYFIWPVVAAVVLVITYVSAKRTFATNKLLSQAVRYRFSSDGVEVHGPLSSGTCRWDGIQHAEETASAVLLWISMQQAYILPKRYFVTPSSLQGFRTLVTHHLGTRATLRSGA